MVCLEQTSLGDIDVRFSDRAASNVDGAFEQQRHDSGLVDDNMWPAWAAGCIDVLTIKTARVVWAERKTWLAKDFATWLDAETTAIQ